MSASPKASGGRFSMDDYIDVAERIFEFSKKYPSGTLQTISWTVETVDDHTFIVYRAAAYRTPDDERPGQGIAWEPFPGRTPYTKDSELMNAETAAWGRAIVACGLTSNRKIASLQEVKARSGEDDPPTPATPAAPTSIQPTARPAAGSDRPATAKQKTLIEARARDAELTPSEFANVLLAAGGTEPRTWPDDEAPTRLSQRMLSRLPAKAVNAVLEQIQATLGQGT